MPFLLQLKPSTSKLEICSRPHNYTILWKLVHLTANAFKAYQVQVQKLQDPYLPQQSLQAQRSASAVLPR